MVGTTCGELTEVRGEKPLERQRRQQKEDGRFQASSVDKRKGKARKAAFRKQWGKARPQT